MLAVNRRVIVLHPIVLAAPTEQHYMTGGSVVTAVEGGHPRRQQLDLWVSNGAVFLSIIAKCRVRQVHGGIEVE